MKTKPREKNEKSPSFKVDVFSGRLKANRNAGLDNIKDTLFIVEII
jgi:hypothetical protein